jgi:NAD(P)-dependent dehydrogenase (short-subunit alcohol dehydrogenase family)
MDLTNASAIVTGGAGGFGAATVRGLAQMGAKVVLADGLRPAEQVGLCWASRDSVESGQAVRSPRPPFGPLAKRSSRRDTHLEKTNLGA